MAPYGERTREPQPCPAGPGQARPRAGRTIQLPAAPLATPLVLERERPQQFDALFLDTFSSDAVPVYLLTLEAFEVYRRHVKPGGVIAVHISSHFFDLQPAVRSVAEELGFQALYVTSPYDKKGVWTAEWMLLTQNEAFVADEFVQRAIRHSAPSQRRVPAWTDDHANLLALFRRE